MKLVRYDENDRIREFRRKAKKLPIGFRVLGSILTYEMEAETRFVSLSELTKHMLETSLINGDYRAAYKSVYAAIRELVKRKIVTQSSINESVVKQEIFQSPRAAHLLKAEYVYALAEKGEKVLRYISPYVELFKSEPVLPISIYKASKELSSLLKRSSLFSQKKLAERCLMSQIGKQKVVLRSVDLKSIRKRFTDPCQVSFYEFKRYLSENGILIESELENFINSFLEEKRINLYGFSYILLRDLDLNTVSAWQFAVQRKESGELYSPTNSSTNSSTNSPTNSSTNFY